ncbi:MAG TPA: restriction endonuclease [Thermoanaerobaculia bacterium]|nr:restriction endonuclease [Thermoanaerobaculia bacterium]
MTSSDDAQPDWRMYERVVAAIEAENADMDTTVSPNVRIEGTISKVRRQIDVLIEARWPDDRRRRIIVDAKHRGRRIDVKDVESFGGMMEDCGAEHGILVALNGFTPAAERRAQDRVTLRLLDAEDVEDAMSWAVFEDCVGRCTSRRSKRPGFVTWDAQPPLGVGGAWAIVWSGKCDVCHQFHVWCWSCGEVFAVANGRRRRCGCDFRWVVSPLRGADGKVDEYVLELMTDEGTIELDHISTR